MTNIRMILECYMSNIDVLDEVFEDLPASFAPLEGDFEDCEKWRVEAIVPQKTDLDALKSKVFLCLGSDQIIKCDFQEEVEKDWITINLQSFKPIEIGSFWIYNLSDSDKKRDNKINIAMDASRAFGSGSHETTRECILALEYLSWSGFYFDNILDMGSGSGILSIAMAKLWENAKILAADIDPIAQEVARKYINLNGVANNITTTVGDGYNNEDVRARAPYDLIVSNILANPIIEMSASSAQALENDAHIVLSGFMFHDLPRILDAYKDMKLIYQQQREGWVAIILQKCTDNKDENLRTGETKNA